MLFPKLKLETVQFMGKEDYISNISYDLITDEYNFKINEKINDLTIYSAEFYRLFERKIREITSEVIRDFIIDRIISYNRMHLECYREYYNLDY